MEAREYTKQIEVWQSTEVDDGFGGSTVTDALQYTFWAKAETKNAYRENENGQNDNFVQTIFTVRNRIDLAISVKDNFIKYKGLVYNIDSVLNIGLLDIDIQIKATQRDEGSKS